MSDDLISIAEAARQIGVNKSTLARQVKAGSIRSHDGKVRLSEVLEDRAANIDLTRSQRRDGRGDALEIAPLHIAPDATEDATVGEDYDPATVVFVDGVALPYAKARALKETYLAWLRKLEFDQKRGALIEVDAAAEVVEQEYATVRERLLAIPGKVASRCVGRDLAYIESSILLEISEALEELHAHRRQGEI
jgi:transposase-like protein